MAWVWVSGMRIIIGDYVMRELLGKVPDDAVGRIVHPKRSFVWPIVWLGKWRNYRGWQSLYELRGLPCHQSCRSYLYCTKPTNNRAGNSISAAAYSRYCWRKLGNRRATKFKLLQFWESITEIMVLPDFATTLPVANHIKSNSTIYLFVIYSSWRSPSTYQRRYYHRLPAIE